MNDWTLLPTSSANPGRGSLPSPNMRSQVFISRFDLPVGTLLFLPLPLAVLGEELENMSRTFLFRGLTAPSIYGA